MCELLALSSHLPTSVKRSLSEFAQHRGAADGWGVAFYDMGDVRLYKEPELAAESQWLAFIQQRRLAASLIMAYIRHATRGMRSLPNTQPFSRELGGQMHVFAHNGRLDSIERDYAGSWTRFQPIGETDSEIAFCILLELVPDRLCKLIMERAENCIIMSLGAGPDAHGQLLIYHDMFGLYPKFKPKMAKEYGNAGEVILNGLKSYHDEVIGGKFPEKENYFGMPDDEFDELVKLVNF